ncbi:MAG TPA: glycosyl hydrolase family 18 protein [Bacteroidota bacterium]|nr:glycosyl hydrolase family 18 protein [Bacteroidota bacterium]
MINYKSLFPALLCAFAIFAAAVGGTASAQTKIWATAYYAGWAQGYNNTGNLPAQAVDYTAITQINHFALVPKSDGTLDDQSNSVTAYNASVLIPLAHAAGAKVLITVGGWGSDVNFRSATSSSTLPTFVANLVNLMKSRGYDGIDVDWETLLSSDATQYSAFITSLRAALDAVSPRPMLTASTAWQPGIFASLAGKFDQVNLMTYDMSGAWPGWVTWHNSPIYSGGYKFPSTGGAVPSSDGWINSFASGGVPLAKLGIGIDFYGYVWSGGAGTPAGGSTAPRQSWTTAPSVQSNVPYSSIMQTYYQPQYYRFDSSAQVSYLSIDNSGSSNDKFISYDDQVTCQKKVQYAQTKGIGGVIIWELGGGYCNWMPAGQRDQLLQAVKSALGGSGTVADTTKPKISLTSPANGSTLSNAVTLGATASDNIAVAGVQFKLNGSNLGNPVLIAPYSYSWNSATVSNGTYTISAVASDAAGNTATASVTVNVTNTVITPVRDTIPPTVSISSPANGSTVSGAASVTASASDNGRVSSVQFKLDGIALGSALTTSPYSYSWNTALSANGSHTLAAIATDTAGNQATASVTVTVSNSTSSSTDLWVYQEGLSSPWMNTSWSSTETFNSTDHSYAGTYAIKVAQTAWGALSMHDGSWSSPVALKPSSYQAVEFAVYGGASGVTIDLLLENDPGNSFPTIACGTVAANTWKVLSVPMTSLDPKGYAINRFDILEESGGAKTYYVDNIRFVGVAQTASETSRASIEGVTAPGSFRLDQNYPNPFNPTTTIAYSLPQDASITLEVYNTLGQRVKSLVSEPESAGEHAVSFDASALASGVYFYRLTAVAQSNGDVVFNEMKRMVLAK